MPFPPVLLLCTLAAAPAGEADRPFAIEVVDDQTGRGVPLVELRTVHGLRLYTDSQGIAAFREPGLMDQTVYFEVSSHGYEYPKDGYGFHGKALDIRPGGAARLTIHRLNVAERLYRVTGAGIYRNSHLVGREAPIKHPLLNAKVLGSDSVQSAVYRGKIHWFWGDTNRPAYPLGNYHVPGATSRLPADGGLDPERGVDLDYFVGNDGFARPTARMPGNGPTWIDGLVVLKDPDGRERMFAAFAKIRNSLETYERGLAEFDDRAERFEKVANLPLDGPLLPGGHPFFHSVNGVEYVYFADPYPLVRVRADPESLLHPERYEAFTCLVQGSPTDRPRVDRTGDGRTPRFAWKAGTPAVDHPRQARLLKQKRLEPDEALLGLTDVETGREVVAHRGSVYWNAYRKRWVMITVEIGGTSQLGEVWFAEADTPLGPWAYARKVVTHDHYSFYNPKQHPMFAKDGGRIIFFEGTYTRTFSGNPDPTPLYDYNQIMYRLDLSDKRLSLPVPIYHLSDTENPPSPMSHDAPLPPHARPAFFAHAHAAARTVPIVAVRSGQGGWTLKIGDAHDADILFHALPPDIEDPPPATVALYQHRGDGRSEVTTAEPAEKARPLCRVWRSPRQFPPLADQ